MCITEYSDIIDNYFSRSISAIVVDIEQRYYGYTIKIKDHAKTVIIDIDKNFFVLHEQIEHTNVFDLQQKSKQNENFIIDIQQLTDLWC